ncbi:hypothetical protein ZIOFF_066329 [Zingiber officinale]|uniref:ribulose-phosphate 3-epimerase n=1 Tax=Zingiber officinale TaxID=94328 RepID=A0A8J5KHS4_ZINOF|nr:hypothetical protein ZIOFF_066329 [Zingiber officinale]
MAVEPKIAPSMLSSDFANLASEAERMIQLGADWLHMDIMKLVAPVGALAGWDGFSFKKRDEILALSVYGTPRNTKASVAKIAKHFVPNLTIGTPVIESLRKHTKAYLDCHLMVTNPLDYVEPLAKAGASGFTFHVEVTKEYWQQLVNQIKTKGMRPGVALKPGTPIEEVYPLVEGENPVEMVLVMTVEPGFGGQKFMPETMDKVRTLRKKYPTLDIEAERISLLFLCSISTMPPSHNQARRSPRCFHSPTTVPATCNFSFSLSSFSTPSPSTALSPPKKWQRLGRNFTQLHRHHCLRQ